MWHILKVVKKTFLCRSFNLVDLSEWTLKIRQKDFVSNDAYRLLVLGTFVLDSRKNCANESIAGCQDILQQYVELPTCLDAKSIGACT